jgi:hypothetical protein
MLHFWGFSEVILAIGFELTVCVWVWKKIGKKFNIMWNWVLWKRLRLGRILAYGGYVLFVGLAIMMVVVYSRALFALVARSLGITNL